MPHESASSERPAGGSTEASGASSAAALTWLQATSDGAGAGIAVAAFADRAQVALHEMVREETAGTAFEAHYCPNIDRYLDLYRHRPPDRVARALTWFLGGHSPETPDEAVEALVARTRQILLDWLGSGTPPPVPPGEIESPDPPLVVDRSGRGARPALADRPQSVLARLGTGRPLPSDTRARWERGFGASLDHVRLHDGAEAAALGADLNARAFRVADHVAVSEGRFTAASPEQDILLAHEIAHTLSPRGATEAGTEASANRTLLGALPGAYGLDVDGEALTPRRSSAELSLERCCDEEELSDAEVAQRYAETAISIDPPGENGLFVEGPYTVTLDAEDVSPWGTYPRPRAFTITNRTSGEEMVRQPSSVGSSAILLMAGDGGRAEYEIGAEIEVTTGRFMWMARRITVVEPTAHVGTLQSELAGLYAEQETIAYGTGDPDRLEAIRDRIAELETELGRFGVNLRGTDLRAAVLAGQDLTVVRGHLGVRPGGPVILGQTVHVDAALDYQPPGEDIEYEWRWRPLGSDGEFQFLEVAGRTSTRSITLQESFWSVADPGDVRDAGGLELFVRVFVGDDDDARTTLRHTLEVQAGLPESISISGPSTTPPGQRAVFRIGEWSPLFNDYPTRTTVDWYVDGALIADESPVFNHSFDDTGTYTLQVRVYEDDGDTRTEIRRADRSIRVASLETIGEEALARDREVRDLRSLDDFQQGIRDARTEAGSRAAAGNEFWRARERAQAQRLERVQEHLEALGDAVEDLPEDALAVEEAMSYAGPIRAMLVLEDGSAQPLDVYLTIRHDGDEYVARIVEATGAEVSKFDGTGSTPLAAYTAVFEDWHADNIFPLGGRVVYDFDPPGWTLGDSFETTTAWRTAIAFVDGLLTVGAIVATGLLIAAPEAFFTKALGMVLLAAMTARSAIQIHENVDRGVPLSDPRNVLEGLSILTSFLGVGGSVLRQAGIRLVRPIMYRVGSWTVMASFAGDMGTMVYMTSTSLDAIRAIESDPTLDDDTRAARIAQISAQLILQGGMTFVSNRDMFSGPGRLRSSDFFPTDVPSTVAAGAGRPDVQLDPGTRLDVASELRVGGDDVSRLRPGEAPDADTGHPGSYSDQEVLQRYGSLTWLRSGELGDAEVRQMMGSLETGTLRSLDTVTPTEAHTLHQAYGAEFMNRVLPVLEGAPALALHERLGAGPVRGLADELGPGPLRALHDAASVDGVERLLDGLTTSEAGALVRDLGVPAVSNLVQQLSGQNVQALVDVHGAARVQWAGQILPGTRAQHLLNTLDGATLTLLQTQGTPAQTRKMADILADDAAAAADVTGRADLLPALDHARDGTRDSLQWGFEALNLEAHGVSTAEARIITRGLQGGGRPRTDVAELLHLTPDQLEAVARAPLASERLEALAVGGAYIRATTLTPAEQTAMVSELADIAASDRIFGIRDWQRFSMDAGNPGANAEIAANLRDDFSELQIAHTMVGDLAPGEHIFVGGDERAHIRPGTTERLPSFDIAVSGPGGTSRNVEVYAPRSAPTMGTFNSAITHAADKIIADPALPGHMQTQGGVEAALRLEWPTPPQALGPNQRVTQADGTRQILDPAGTVRHTDNLFDDYLDLLNTGGATPRAADVGVLTVYDQAGHRVYTFTKDPATGVWTGAGP